MLLLTFSLGAADIGLAWRSSMTVASGVRSATRVAAHLGTAGTTDHAALLALASQLGPSRLPSIEFVAIYRANDGGGHVPAMCTTTGAVSSGGVTGQCNVYPGTRVIAIANNPTGTQATFPGGCRWCPASRANTQTGGGGLDTVGVYIKYRHRTMTRMFGTFLDIDDESSMTIEPDAGSS